MRKIVRFVIAVVAVLLWSASSLCAMDTLIWRARENSIDAEINNWPLQRVLGKIAKATGWQVFVEPGASATISAKFKKLSTDDALRRLLGNISFAIARSNGVARLVVYETDAQAATQLVVAEKKTNPKDYLIGNELIVRLKKNSKVTIEELAKLTRAKILSRDDAHGIYRLQFADEKAAAAARKLLENNEDVAWVDSNYSVDRPTPMQMVLTAAGAEFAINPKTSDCTTIGLIDTVVQPQPGLEKYMLPPISVVGDVTATGDIPTHGTGIFETMLNSMGNSPAKILSVVIYPDDASAANGTSEATTTYEVAQAILKAVNAGANPINLSLGGTGNSPFLGQLIADATKKGIVFIAAAGNEPGKALTFPAAYPGVVAVTASGMDGKLASYANSGDFVQAMASGYSVVVVNGQAWEMQGTSVATARVTGTLAAKATQDCTSPAKWISQVVAALPVKQ